MRGQIIRRSKTDPQKYSVVVYLGIDPATGKERRKWESGRGSDRAAHKHLNRLLADVQSGSYVEPSKQTVAQYLRLWLQSHRPNVEPSVSSRYEEIIEKHLVPNLGHHKITSLNGQVLDTYYGQALTSGRRDGTGGLSPQTVVHFHRLLHKAFQTGVKQGILQRNPCDLATPPRVDRKEPAALAEDDTVALLAAVEGTALWLPLVVSVTTGLRRGELLALKWSAVDFDAGVLHVRESLEWLGETYRFKPPKTKKSRRSLSVPAFVVTELLRYREQQEAHISDMGSAYQDHDLLFCEEHGLPIKPRNFSKRFHDTVRRKGVTCARFPDRKVRLHDLRHSHASHLLKLGEGIRLVSERLGHADPGFTLRVYAHVLPGQDQAAAQKINAAFGELVRRPQDEPAP